MSVLPLFPNALANSVITTVWIGVWVIAFFALRFGWSLSGMVVPGYLTPLLLVKPVSACVVIVEGVVTYLLVYGFSERLSRLGGWCSLFGRDRFFAVILVSVAVRLTGDSWVWPWVGEHWNEYFQQNFDYRNNLYSFGLIIVALIGNSFWKTGLRAGALPIAVAVGSTYLIVRYGLLELTNFSIGNLSYTYDDLAISLLAAPKAYIVLLTAAWVASRMNLFYGWDFNGIMIPSLIALQWYQPIGILASGIEILIILVLVRLLLKIPVVSRLHWEGPREILLFFNVSFAYKMAIGWLLPMVWPTLQVVDVFGLGYLLTSLIAMRMHNQEIVARVARATLQTSLIAVGIASLAGFALTLLPSPQQWTDTTPDAAAAIQTLDRPLMELLGEDRVSLKWTRPTGTAPSPTLNELAAFKTGMERLRNYLKTGDAATLASAVQPLRQAHYEITIDQQRYVFLRERAPANGWGSYVLDRRAPGQLLVEIPAPLDEPGASAAGGWLFDRLGGQALAMAGTRRNINPNRSLDVLTDRQTVFQVFHDVMARRDVLQVRGYTSESIGALAPEIAGAYRAGEAQPPTLLWVKGKLPPGLNLATLKRFIGDVDSRWASAPMANRQQESTVDGFAELFLNRSNLRRLIARATVSGFADAPLKVGELRINGYLQEWLLASTGLIADRGTNVYRPPSAEELLYFDEEILSPLLDALRNDHHQNVWTAAGLEGLRAIAGSAEAIGYHLLRYQHRYSGREYVVLAEDEAPATRRYWGSYVFRLGEPSGYMVQVPHPLFEVNAFEYGLSLFDELQGDTLLLAGAHPEANLDGSSDVLNPDHARSVFSLVNQVVLREAGRRSLLGVAVRTYSVTPDAAPPPVDVLLSWSNGMQQLASVGPLGQGLLKRLRMDGLSYQMLTGSAYAAGLHIGGIPQTRYLTAAKDKELALLWLSPLAKIGYRQQSDNISQQAQFDAVAIPTVHEDLRQRIAGLTAANGLPPADWQAALRAYMERRDIVDLQQLRAWREYSYQRVIDRDTQMAFLLVFDERQRLRLVANLNPRQPDVRMTAGRPPSVADIEAFKAAQAGWLMLEQP